MITLKLTRAGEDQIEIDALFKSLTITKEIGVRGENISFGTQTQIKEWDIIEASEEKIDDYTYNGVAITYIADPLQYTGKNLVFSGIIDRPSIDDVKGGKVLEYTGRSSGWKRLIDRGVIAKRYINRSSGNIVRDILTEYAPDFTEGNIEEGIFIESVPINNLPPTEAIDLLASANGFTWRIDSKKRVYFELQTRDKAPLEITPTGNFYKKLRFSPSVEEIVNTVIIIGGNFVSNPTTYTTIGNSETRQFVLPEKPKNVTVRVNGVKVSLGIKFGDETPTSDFQLNYSERYIENGTHTTLTASDVLEVEYSYDIPLRFKYQDVGSVERMQSIFPETNGEFITVIEDTDIEDRAIAEERAKAEIEAKGNPIITGSFTTFIEFLPGQVLTIDMAGYLREVVITKVKSKSIGGGIFEHSVSFATVLYQFEDFLRGLLKKDKLSLNDNEVVENIQAFTDIITLDEYFIPNDDENITRETVTLTESYYFDKVPDPIKWVYGNYLPFQVGGTPEPIQFTSGDTVEFTDGSDFDIQYTDWHRAGLFDSLATYS